MAAKSDVEAISIQFMLDKFGSQDLFVASVTHKCSTMLLQQLEHVYIQPRRKHFQKGLYSTS